MKSLDWVLDTDGELPMVETLRADRKFLAVVLESSQTRFFSGPPDDPTSIHKSWIEIWIGRRIVPISLPQPAIIGLLKLFKKIIIFNSRK